MLLPAKIKLLLLLSILLSLSACGFHLQGRMNLAPPLKSMYLQTADPYGYLSRNLQTALRMSHVELAPTPQQAATVLAIHEDRTTQRLMGVNSTTQTRQYEVGVVVVYSILNSQGVLLLPAETLAETRVITMQSNQILGSSNELNLYYQQMRRNLANAIMNRISSKQVSDLITHEINTRTT